jgi:hypothetical protein
MTLSLARADAMSTGIQRHSRTSRDEPSLAGDHPLSHAIRTPLIPGPSTLHAALRTQRFLEILPRNREDRTDPRPDGVAPSPRRNVHVHGIPLSCKLDPAESETSSRGSISRAILARVDARKRILTDSPRGLPRVRESWRNRGSRAYLLRSVDFGKHGCEHDEMSVENTWSVKIRASDRPCAQSALDEKIQETEKMCGFL